MSRDLRPLCFYVAPVILAGAEAAVALSPSLVPGDLRGAILRALALTGIFALGATGLTFLRAGLLPLFSPGAMAIAICVITLVRVREGADALFQLGALDAAYAGGMWIGAFLGIWRRSLDRRSDR
jgi:hypothetical protein